jgi:hypothetical protein
VLAIAITAFSVQAERGRLSPITLVTGAYVLAFPFPVLFPDFYSTTWRGLYSVAADDAMLWALRAFAALIIAYWISSDGRVSWQERRRSALTAYSLDLIKFIGWLSLAAWLISVLLFGLVLTFIETQIDVADNSGTLKQVLRHAIDLRYPFFLLFMLLLLQDVRSRQLTALLGLIIATSLVEIAVIGSKKAILNVLVAFLLIFMIVPFHFRLKHIAVGVTSLVMVWASFVFVSEYRSIVRDAFLAGEDISSIGVQTTSFQKAFVNSVTVRSETATEETGSEVDAVAGRFGGGMFSWANLLHFTDGRSPQEFAVESFFVPIYSLAPRVFAADKPIFFHSGRYAQEFFGWEFGGISVSLIGSLYYTWGYVGIIAGMSFLGWLLAFATHRARSITAYSTNWLVILVTLVIMMLDVGVTFHAIVTNLVRLIAFLWLLRVGYPFIRNSIWLVLPIRRGA